MASVSSHLFAAGDIDYINNLNLVRTDIGGLVTEANAKGTMSTQNANAVAITGGSAVGLSSVGVGTSSPISKLDVYGGVGDGSSFDSVLTLSRTSSTGNVLACKWVLDDKDVNHGNAVLRIKTTASGAESPAYYTDALCVDGQNGYLGVGTPSPASTLHTSQAAGGTFAGIVAENTSASSVSSAGVLYRTVNGDWYLTASRDGYFSLKGTLGSEVWRVAGATNNLLLSTTTDNGTDKLQVNGTASATSPAGGANNTQLATTAWVVGKGYIASGGAIQSTSPTSGVGYATGAGGSVTQTTSLSTGVTLNAVCGKIITFNGNIAANSYESFTFTNSAIGDDDVVVVTLTNLLTAVGNVTVSYYGGVGSKYIILRNHTASAVSGSCTIKFAVIKAVAA